MAKYRIAWMPGDGIGVDVMKAARIVLDALGMDAEYVAADIGWHFWCTEGEALPERTLETLKTCDCALFGAITSKPRDEAEAELTPELRGKGLSYRSPIVRLRQLFDLYINLRPCKALPGNPLNYRDDIDLVVFRENTEGLYAGVEFHPLADDLRGALARHSPAMERFADVAGEDIAITCRVVTRRGARRIIRAAFEYARKFDYPTVTIVEKPNVLRETSGLMVREARAIAQEYPGIDLWETNIDAQMMWLLKNPQDYGVMVTGNMFGDNAAMQLVRTPKSFDVIVTGNMFGDILSDLAAQLVGGLGFASSGNIGDDFGVFEPTHGSAPKYAGQYKANPTAMLLAVRLMLDWLGEVDLATRLETGISRVVQEGAVRTYDLGGDSTTLDVAHAVVERM
jgi:isocitrate/isopropylmalate dehydrogenase